MHSVTVHGVAIPALGLGSVGPVEGPAQKMIEEAIAVGYRHIDTAQMYRNEDAVGAAVRASGLPRSEIWITTKVLQSNYPPADFRRSVEESVAKLGGPPDVLLLHWPRPMPSLDATLAALNAVRADGLCHHIGLSNFSSTMIREATSRSDAPLLVNQVEYHPYLSQRRLLQEMATQEMALIAYCPLARGRVASDPVVQHIASKHAKTPAQITLRWLVQQPGVVAIPKTARSERLKENADIFDFALDDAEMTALHQRATPKGRLIDPADWRPVWDTA